MICCEKCCKYSISYCENALGNSRPTGGSGLLGNIEGKCVQDFSLNLEITMSNQPDL